MKMLYRADPDTLLKLENSALRRALADVEDELAGLRRELDSTRAAATSQLADIDDLLDLANTYSLAAPAERLSPREWPWTRWVCQDTANLTVEQAHTVMQQHRRCLTGECRVRTTAVRVLREKGHLVPDSGRPSLHTV